MSGLEPWLLLANSLNPLAPGEGLGKTGGLVLRDLLLILGSGMVLTTLLLFWARSYVRRSKRSRQRHHHRHPSSSIPTPAARTATASNPNANLSEPASDPAGRQHHHRRRRRRRRDHRSRNPSLAEAGGLPPQRSDPSPPPVS